MVPMANEPLGGYELGRSFRPAQSYDAPKGTLREALYVHDAYHDVHLYGLSTDKL